jgi:hypothetical protein
MVKGKEREVEEGLIPIAAGLEGKSLDPVVHLFHFAAAEAMLPPAQALPACNRDVLAS